MRNLQEEYSNMRKEFEKIALPSILANAKEVFDRYPFINSFAIYGYAPYFNDGDACTFYIQECQFNINGIQYYDGHSYKDVPEVEYEESVSERARIIAAYKAAEVSIREFIYTIPSEMFEHIFGGDQQVTFNRDGTYANEDYGSHN